MRTAFIRVVIILCACANRTLTKQVRGIVAPLLVSYALILFGHLYDLLLHLAKHLTMSESLCDRVMTLLSEASRPMSVLEIARAMGMTTRREINPTLYDLQKQGKLQNNGKIPLMWSITPLEVASSPFSQDSGSTSELAGDVARILAFLSRASKACTALEIAKAIGYKTRREVNPHLYAMAKEGLVVHDDSKGTPLWNVVSSKQHHATEQATGPCDSTHEEIKSHVLDVLRAKLEVGQTALEIANTVGNNATRRVVKSALESLKQERKVKCLGTTPEQWVIYAPRATLSGSSSTVSDLTKNPISALSEYCQSKHLELSFPVVEERGPPNRKTFVIAATFGSEQFRSESSNKKEAKRMAADLALQSIRGRFSIPLALPSAKQTATSQLLSFCDRIHAMSHDKFLELQQSIKTPQPGRKVIAAFIMEDTDTSDMKVISMGSGTQCVVGDQTSPKGLAVNDSHAEVVARRSLMRFFYKELLAKLTNTSMVFVDSATSGLAKVRDGLKFHLYISTAPCGDGGLFSREDNHNRLPPIDNAHRPTIENKKQGLLRTKIEGGEGTIPPGENVQQTWDGILRGERLLTMSCSDKILRWNVLGLQGALLSQFMEPLYMSSLTLGSLHHHGHLSRAVCCRAKDIECNLPKGFTLNHPSLGRAQDGDVMERHTEKTSSVSLNWAHGDEKAELADGVTGKIRLEMGAHVPRISKAHLFTLYAELYTASKASPLTITYIEAKNKSYSYNEAKVALFKLFHQKGYGVWVEKPEELQQFKIKDISSIVVQV